MLRDPDLWEDVHEDRIYVWEDVLEGRIYVWEDVLEGRIYVWEDVLEDSLMNKGRELPSMTCTTTALPRYVSVLRQPPAPSCFTGRLLGGRAAERPL